METSMKPDEFSYYASSAALSLVIIHSEGSVDQIIEQGIMNGIEFCKGVQIGSNTSKETFCTRDLEFQFRVHSYTKRIPNLNDYFGRADIMQSDLQFILDSQEIPSKENLQQYLDYFDHISKALTYLDEVDRLSEDE